MIDYAMLPPEINSARMYAGAGSAPLREASVAWSKLAAEMRSAAVTYSSIITNLTTGAWRGPASASMAAAAAPFAAWMHTTATQAEQTSTQAQAAVHGYEAAFAMTVPPAKVAANRAELKMLVAHNIVGQNAAAIATNEAHYGEMWAQDAAAMYSYAGSSSTASKLAPFSKPAATTKDDAATSQATAQAATQASSQAAAQASSPLSILSSWWNSLVGDNTNTSTTGVAGLLNFLDGSNGSLVGSFLSNATISNLSNAFTTSGLLNPTTMIDSVTEFSYLYPALAAEDAAADAAAAAGGLGGLGGLGALGGLGGLGAAFWSGEANTIGALSVPAAWGTVAPNLSLVSLELPGATALAPPLGGTPMVMPDAPAGMPMLPLPAMGAGEDNEFGEPIYGIRPMVMARPPAAG